MIPWINGSEPKPDPEGGQGEAKRAVRVQEEKLKETLLTVSDVQETAKKSRRLLDTDLLAVAIERSMRRA